MVAGIATAFIEKKVMTDMHENSLAAMNRHTRDNIKALMGYLGRLYKHDRKLYEELADGFEDIHGLLLANTEKFRSAWKATFWCYKAVVRELEFAGYREKPGFVAAKEIFERRLK